MYIIDPDIKKHLGSALAQGGLATLVIFIIFLFLDILIGPTVVAALGATSFIVFAMPHYPPAQPRRLLGGYIIGTLTGTGASLLAGRLSSWTAIGDHPLQLLFAAVAVGATILAMVITDTAHPPAAGLALGYVIDAWDMHTVAFVLAAVVLLAVSKRLLRRYLLDLV